MEVYAVFPVLGSYLLLLALNPLSDACREEYISHIQKGVVRFGMTVSCGEDKPVYTFELTLSPTEKDREGGAKA